MLASASQHAMPQRWMELNAARRQRQRCAEDVEAVRQACEKECQKENVYQCSSCYEKVLERMRSRYRNSDEAEWFTQRRAFLQELDSQFADVKQRKRSLKSVEAGIESEKEAWYRWMLRQYPDFLAVADNGVHRSRLRGMMDDPDLSREELVSSTWEGVGKPENWSSRTDEFAEKVAAARADESALRKLYEEEFFTDSSTGGILEHAQKYLDEYKANSSMTLEDVVDLIMKDHQQSRGTQSQRERNIERLGELQRAKKAFEQNRLRAKGLANTAPTSTAREELYDLPPCLVCQGKVGTKDILSCSVCQAVSQMGGDNALAVYCSEACYHKGHDGHVKKQHACVAGERCIRVQGEDVLMEDGESPSVACKECLDQKQLSLYCSEACALAHIADHRQSKHGVKTAAEETQGLLTRSGEAVESILRKENPGLTFWSV